MMVFFYRWLKKWWFNQSIVAFNQEEELFSAKLFFSRRTRQTPNLLGIKSIPTALSVPSSRNPCFSCHFQKHAHEKDENDARFKKQPVRYIHNKYYRENRINSKIITRAHLLNTPRIEQVTVLYRNCFHFNQDQSLLLLLQSTYYILCTQQQQQQ